jgi:hypothetical protein
VFPMFMSRGAIVPHRVSSATVQSRWDSILATDNERSIDLSRHEWVQENGSPAATTVRNAVAPMERSIPSTMTRRPWLLGQ